MPDLLQNIIKVSSIRRCINGTVHWRNCSDICAFSQMTTRATSSEGFNFMDFFSIKRSKYLVQYNFFSVPTLKCLNSLLYWQSIYYSSHNHSIHQSSPKMHYIYVPTSSVKSWIAQRIRTPSGLPYMLFLFLLSFYLSFTYLCICQNNKYHERDRNFNYPICALRFVNIIDSKSGNFEIF